MRGLLFLLVLNAFVPSLRAAEEGLLRDPTRPVDAPASSSGNDVAGGLLRLDMVIRPVSGKPTAIINGETMKIGDEIQGLKLMVIGESSVQLRGADGKETVTLVPGIEKTMRSTQINRPAIVKKPGGGT